MPKLIAFLSMCALLVLALGLAIWLRFSAPFGSWGRGLDTPAIVRQMQQMKELVSVRYVIQKVIGLREPKSPFGQESILLMVQAKVIAGIDLAEITPHDVEVKDRRHMVLRLPPPHLVDAYLDEKETKVWDRRITWWTPWVAADPDLERKARMAALEEVRKAALEAGILGDAEKSAETAIRDFLKAFGIEVEFRPATQRSMLGEPGWASWVRQAGLGEPAPPGPSAKVRVPSETAVRFFQGRESLGHVIVPGELFFVHQSPEDAQSAG